METSRFSAQVTNTTAKRAANRCSNPDCEAVTSGPSEEPSDAISVGEAAHIFGANPGSARFDPKMSPAERAAIVNAIWLCRNCHKRIDDNEAKYPTGLLFEWKREHERRVSEALGKPGARARDRYIARHLAEFGPLSYLAEQIIIDKPDHWEYRLAAELLRSKAGPVFKRWEALRKGLYFQPLQPIGLAEMMGWVRCRQDELDAAAHAFDRLLNEEFQAAWGEPGQAGSDLEIVRVCGLFAECCTGLLEWEERVRFVMPPDEFEQLHQVLIGTAGYLLDELAKVPADMAKLFSGEPKAGVYKLSLTFDLPDGWVERFSAALQLARSRLGLE